MSSATVNYERTHGATGQLERYGRMLSEDIDGDFEEGVWTETTPAVFGPEDPDTLERPVITPAVWEMVTSTRKLDATERARWEAAERADLTPKLSESEVNETVGLLVEDAFKHQRQGEYSVGLFGQLVALLASKGVISAAEAAAVAPDSVMLDTIREAVRAEVRGLEENPAVKEALVVDRLRGARGKQR